MKKYLIRLVNNDISRDINCLKQLERIPNDEYLLRRKQSLENKINKNTGYLRRLLVMDIQFRKEQEAQVSDTTKMSKE